MKRGKIKILFLKNLVLIIYLFSLIHVVHADSFNGVIWEQTAGPPGGIFHIVKVSPKDSNSIFAGSTRSLFVSRNAGEDWERVILTHVSAEQFIGAIEFDIKNPNIIYVGASDGIFKSTDYGKSWEKMQEKENLRMITAIAIDPEESNILYAGALNDGDSRIFKSTDSGETWKDITNNLHIKEINSIIVDKKDSIWMGAGHEMAKEGSLYHSTDGGSSWKVIDIGAQKETFVSEIALDPFDSNHIIVGLADAFNRGGEFSEHHFETRDGGKTWNKMIYSSGPSCPDIPQPNPTDIEFSRSKKGIFYMISPAHKTTDGGKTFCGLGGWQKIEDFGTAEQTSIATDPNNENILYATYIGQGIAKSTDEGKTWWLANKGLINPAVTNIAVHPTDEKVVYVSGGDGSGTWKTEDRGETWGILNKGGITHPWVDELATEPANGNIVYDIADIGNIYRSEDAGMAWEQINNGFSFSSIYAMAVHPTDEEVVYVINNGQGMFKGNCRHNECDWRYLLGSPDYSYSIAIDPENPNIIYSGYNKKVFEKESKVYRSEDAGESWGVSLAIPSAQAVTSVAIDKQNPNNVYAGATGKKGEIYVSNDKGVSWDKLNNKFTFSTIHTITVDPNNEEVVYSAPWGAGLFVSEDAGGSWTKIDTPTISIPAIIVDSKNSNHIIIADRTKPKIYQSYDKGKTWKELVSLDEEKYYRISTIALYNGEIYFSVFNKITGMISLFINGPMSGTNFRLDLNDPQAEPVEFSKVIDGKIIIDFFSKDKLYAVSHVYGVYEYDGSKWKDISPDIDMGFNNIIADDNKLYLTGASDIDLDMNFRLEGNPSQENIISNIYRSEDNGNSWIPLLENNPFKSSTKKLLKHPSKDILFAVTATGLYVSDDNGKTWKQHNKGLNFKNTGSMAMSNNYIYVGTLGGGVYSGKINPDNSISWVESNGPFPEIFNIQLKVDPTDSNVIYATSYPGGVFKSTDKGNTWIEINFAMPSFEVTDPLRQGYYALDIDLLNTNNLYLGIASKGVYKSTDGGATWMPMYGKFGQNKEIMREEIYAIKTDPIKEDTIYLATNNGVYFSNDGAENWEQINNGLVTKDIKTLEVNKGKVFVGSRGYGLYYLDKGYDHWFGPFGVSNFGVFWHWWERPLYLYNAMLINPFYPNIIYLGTFPGGFYKSVDKGETWKETNLGFTIDGTFAMEFHPYNKSIIYAGTYNGVSISEDKGKTWRKIEEGMPSEQWVFSFAFDPRNPDIIYATSKNGQNKGFCGRNDFCGGVFKSVDGGENWIELTNGLGEMQEYYQIIMYPFNYDVLFVSSTNGVHITLDAGKTWQDFSSGLEGISSAAKNNVANNMKIDRLGEFLYLGTQGLGVFKADLRELDLPKSDDVYPLHCFNYKKDSDEKGIDCGGDCAVSCEGYDYGFEEKIDIGYRKENLVEDIGFLQSIINWFKSLLNYI